MIDKLKKEVAELERDLAEKKAKLKTEIMTEEIGKLSQFLHSCCRVKSKYNTTAYLVNVTEIDIDEDGGDFINISAEKVVIIDKDPAFVELDETGCLFYPSSDIIEAITEDEVWNMIGQDIKAIM